MSGHVCAENVPIFNHLSHENLEKISGIMQHRCYAKGEIIYSPNKSCGLFILAKGRIKVYQLSGFGKEQLLRVLESGSVIGEDTLFGSINPNSFGEALTDIEACVIGREEFMEPAHTISCYQCQAAGRIQPQAGRGGPVDYPHSDGKCRVKTSFLPN